MTRTVDFPRAGTLRCRPPRIALVMAAIAVGSCVFPSSTLAADSATVIVLNNKLKFVPAEVTIKAGQTVQWKNASDLVHTVTDDPELVARTRDQKLPDSAKSFNSGNLKPKATFEHTFTAPGTYMYFCIPHEGAGMVAQITVTK